MPTNSHKAVPAVEPVNDAIMENAGSLYLFRPLTAAARDWCEEHCPADGEHQYFGGALVVEPRYASDIFHLATRDGLRVA